MTVVVADSSPLNILIRIDAIHVLPGLFGQVVIPPEVRDELSDPRTPEIVRAWMDAPPAWLEIRRASAVPPIPTLNEGERAAIALAREIDAAALLIDDFDGRRAAVQRGLVVIGTLGVLERAAQRHLVVLQGVVDALRATDFRIAPGLLDAALARDQTRPPT